LTDVSAFFILYTITMKSFTIQEIATVVNGSVEGQANQRFTGLEQLAKAKSNQISFIGNRKYAKLWEQASAGAAVINENISLNAGENRALIRVKNADLAMAKLLDLFAPKSPDLGIIDIHPTAVVDETATVASDVKIGAGCYVGKNVKLGKGVILYPNVSVFDDSDIGENTVVWSGTVIRERSIIGSRCIFHLNVSIGADGFGYRPSDDGRGLVKIPHIGNVVIGNDVEIGANSCIDRGKFSSTILGDGCKIDNLVQIGHNCVLGKCCIMAGASGLAGSVTLGDGVTIGGSASIKDHTTLHDGVTVGAGSGVVGDVAAGKTVLGYPACDARDMLKQWVALRKLATS